MINYFNAIILMLLLKFLLCAGTSIKAQPIRIEPGKPITETRRLDNVGRIELEYFLSIDEATEEMTLQLIMRPLLSQSDDYLFIFDRQQETRPFLRENRIQSRDAVSFFRDNPVLIPFYLSNGIIELKEQYNQGRYNFRSERSELFNIDNKKLVDGDIIAFELHFYHGSGGKGRLDRKLNPITVELKISEPVDEAVEVIAEETIIETKEAVEKPIEDPETITIAPLPETRAETPKSVAAPDPDVERRAQCRTDYNNLERQYDSMKAAFEKSQYPSSIREIRNYVESIKGVDIGLLSTEQSTALREDIRIRHEQFSSLLAELTQVRNDFNLLRSEVQVQINRCEMMMGDFAAIRTNINHQTARISSFVEDVRKLSERIENIQEKIDPTMFSVRDQLRQLYGPEFDNMLIDFTGLEERFSELFERFDAKIISESYFRWNKRRFVSQLESINKEHEALHNEYQQQQELAANAFMDSLGVSPSFSANTEENISEIHAIYNRLESGIIRMQKELERFVPKRNPWLEIILSVVIVAILGFGIRVYYFALRKKHKEIKTERKQKNIKVIEEDGKKKVGGVNITQNIKTVDGKAAPVPGKGLDHAIDKIGKDYYEINLHETWEDTKVTKVYIHRKCIIDSYKFFYKSLSVEGKVLEYGGYILGGWEFDKTNPDKYCVSLEEFVEPGDDAIYSEYKLNFGGKIGIRYQNRIREIRGKSGLNFTLTAWFHSHPEIKIFLSESDLIVQERLSSKDHKGALLAMVLDPNTQDEGKIAFYTGIFPYKSDYSMNNNKNDMKLIKWKTLYDWARSPQTPDLSASYCLYTIDFSNDTIIKKVHLSNSAIIKLSELVDDDHIENKYGVFQSKFFYDGTIPNSLLLLEDLHIKNNEELLNNQDATAVFILLGKSMQGIENTIEHLEKQNEVQVIMLFDKSDKSILLLTRKTSGSFNKISEIKKSVSFEQIEAWPTRKR